jgi:hypothetical protein
MLHKIECPYLKSCLFEVPFRPSRCVVFKVVAMFGTAISGSAYLGEHTCLWVLLYPVLLVYFVYSFVLLFDLGIYSNASKEQILKTIENMFVLSYVCSSIFR